MTVPPFTDEQLLRKIELAINASRRAVRLSWVALILGVPSFWLALTGEPWRSVFVSVVQILIVMASTKERRRATELTREICR